MEEYKCTIVASETGEGNMYGSDGWDELLSDTSIEVYDRIVFTLDFVFDRLFVEFHKSRK